MGTTQYDTLLYELPPTQPSERALHRLVWLVVALVGLLVWWPAHAARIKELATVQGVRANQLTGREGTSRCEARMPTGVASSSASSVPSDAMCIVSSSAPWTPRA